MKEEIKTRRLIENIETEPEVVEPKKVHKITQEERINNIKKEFAAELKRDLTDQELTEYIKLFDKEETNFWLYLWKIEPKLKPVKEIPNN